jgi:AbrB family looped-hinge helix DNA binding protein
MTYHAKVYGGGKMAIPADVRRTLGIKDGDQVTLDIENGQLIVKTQKQLLKEIQAYFKSFVPEGVSLVDELIAERRAEAARE